jgi:hypothetical protein
MLRVRLFPGFSTAVLQTGPPTFGVRLNFRFYVRAMDTDLNMSVIVLVGF